MGGYGVKTRRLLFIALFGILLILSACFQGEQSLNEIDPPENAEAVNDVNETEVENVVQDDSETVEATETVPRQLYLIDSNGMVAAQVLELPLIESFEVATQVLEHLVEDGPVTEMLPNGFRAVLPAGTEILGLDLKDDGTMIVDLSEEFKNYQPEDEIKIIESMTHTLTQFENVERVELRINGHSLDEMPVNGTPIGQYSRANGINIIQTDTLDFVNSQAVTMYYPASHQENRYYIPVTQHVEKTGDNLYESIVQALMDGPGFNTNVVHVFNSGSMLVEEPVFEEGVLELVFNEAILEDEEQAVISDEVMETIVRTLTQDDSVEAVDVKVEKRDQLVNENGEVYSEPVTADVFTPSEEL